MEEQAVGGLAWAAGEARAAARGDRGGGGGVDSVGTGGMVTWGTFGLIGTPAPFCATLLNVSRSRVGPADLERYSIGLDIFTSSRETCYIIILAFINK